jgi:hypothetical protein
VAFSGSIAVTIGRSTPFPGVETTHRMPVKLELTDLMAAIRSSH